MGTRTLPFALLALLSLPVAASAQPTLYGVLPNGQILTYTARTNTTAVFFTGTGNFAGPYHDCAVAPDGSVLVAAGAKILRVKSNSDKQFFTLPVAAGSAKGLAMNVTTLFVSTTSGTVYKLVFTDTNPLTFPSGANPVVSPLQGTGQGVVFDHKGDAIIASDSKLYQSAPPLSGGFAYGAPLDLGFSGIAPWGVAMLGCRGYRRCGYND